MRFKALTGCILMLFSLHSMSQTKIVSHVTAADGGFTSEVLIENNSVNNAVFTLTPYDINGVQLTPFEGSLAPLTSSATDHLELFAEGDQVSHFTIEGDVEVTVNYNFKGANGSPAAVAATTDEASIWRIYPGNWSLVFDGVAMVNMGNQSTEIWVTQKDLDGNVLDAARVSSGLTPNAKGLYVIGGPDAPTFDREVPSYFEISANQRLAITALRGTLGREGEPGLLWANRVDARSEAYVNRDEQGIWYIKDGSLYDVMEMLGYTIAHDRLWQTEIFRRSAEGRVAEIFGTPSLNTDVLARESNYSFEEYSAMYEALDTDSKTMIAAYAEGASRRIAQVNADLDILPFEFKRFGIFEVDPWTIHTVMNWLVTVQRNFSMFNLGSGQLNHIAAVQILNGTLGDTDLVRAAFDDLYWTNDPSSLTVIPPTEEALKRAEERKQKSYPLPGYINAENSEKLSELVNRTRNMFAERERHLKEIGGWVKMGSYAWVVSGEHTDTGNPMLYSGPQLNFSAPVTISEGSIESDTLNVQGMVVPGVPAVLVGRTPHHAWSLQVGDAHSFDYYLEEPSNVALHRTETIIVAGAEPVTLNIYRSNNGPILFRAFNGPLVPGELLFAWKYAHWGKELDLGPGILGMARATSLDEFDTAVRRIAVSQHIKYADKEGNIAYWMTGNTPVRPEGDYRFPQNLDESRREWDAEVLEPMPHARNPEQGWFGSWNSKPSVDWVDSASIVGYGPFQRGYMIQDYLASQDTFTFEEIRDLAITISATQNFAGGGYTWIELRKVFKDVVEANPTPERLEAIRLLEEFDGSFPLGGPEDITTTTELDDPWILERNWLRRVMFHIIEDESNDPFVVANLDRHFQLMLRVLSDDPAVPIGYDWETNLIEPDDLTSDEVILRELDGLLERLGPRPWSADVGDRPSIPFDLLGIGPLHATLDLNRSTYGQCVEIGPNGPVRVETIWPLGPSGAIFANDNLEPISPTGVLITGSTDIEKPEDDPMFSMLPFFENFIHRPFPLFGQTPD